MSSFTTLDFNTWVDTYQPLTDCVLELTPWNLRLISQLTRECPNYVWTQVEVDGSLYIINGTHWVNRLGYYVTKVPWITGEEIEVLEWEDLHEIC